MRQIREALIAAFPDTEAATEALYKVGLDLLFRERNLQAAIERFEAAAQRQPPYWAAAARTSLGLCYHHQRRSQKALFELRKVAYAKNVSVHSVTALAFIENIYATEGQTEEASRARRDRSQQLEQAIAHNRDVKGEVGERGFYLLQLGIALKDGDQAERGTACLEEAKALGPQALGADLYRSIVEALGH